MCSLSRSRLSCVQAAPSGFGKTGERFFSAAEVRVVVLLGGCGGDCGGDCACSLSLSSHVPFARPFAQAFSGAAGGGGGGAGEKRRVEALEDDGNKRACVDEALTTGGIIKFIMYPLKGSTPGQMPLMKLLGPVDSMPLRATCSVFKTVVEQHPWDQELKIKFPRIKDVAACCPNIKALSIDGEHVFYGEDDFEDITHMGWEDFDLLSSFGRLKELSISSAFLATHQSLTTIGQLPELKALTLENLDSAALDFLDESLQGNYIISTLAMLGNLHALRLKSCNLRTLKPDWASDLPYLRFVCLDDVTLTTPRSHLFAQNEFLLDLCWKRVEIFGEYTKDGVIVDGKKDILKGLKVRKLATDHEWCSSINFALLPLEEMELWPNDAPETPLDFSKMRGLKRLSIYNEREDNVVHLGNIIGRDDSLAQLSLTHLYIAVINVSDEMEFFRSFPRTLKTIGWCKWNLFSEMCQIHLEEEGVVAMIEDFFRDKRIQGNMGVGTYYGKSIDLMTLFGNHYPVDEIWQDKWSTQDYYHEFLGCTHPWALK